MGFIPPWYPYPDFAKAIRKTLDLDMNNNMMQVYKPWFYPNVEFPMYLRPTGQQTFFKTVKQFQIQLIKKKKNESEQRNKENAVKEVTDEKNLKRFLDSFGLHFELNNDGVNFSNDDIKYGVLTISHDWVAVY